MWTKIEVAITRDIRPDHLITFENAGAEDGIMLNHNYLDMRGHSKRDARSVVNEEADLLRDIEALGEDEEAIEALLGELESDVSELNGFDIGCAGAIYALSAAGAAPITSCNAGLLGDRDFHTGDTPHVLFSVAPDDLPPILQAAEKADVGLSNAEGHAEIYTDSIPKLNVFADELLKQLRA